MNKKPNEVRDELNNVSPSFCLAKWLQVTIHLQNGQTHSCHHPGTHKVPLIELESDPSALHNTVLKKSYRKMMLEGERPAECEYCWKIEDSHPDNLSDRVFKSLNDFHELERISTLPWNQSINPNYLEVSFGNECNFKCAYCAPHISSGLMSEYQKFGNYKTMPAFNLDILKAEGMYPYEKTEENPYVEAFWKWWPDVTQNLHVFRITGGEPLLNFNTFKFLDYLIENPMPDLEIAINSNLGIPNATFDKFISKVKHITETKKVKKFGLYTSVDTHGKNAEFIRFGLKYNDFMKNVETFLLEVPLADVNFMCTYNAFSVINFNHFLEDVTILKTRFRNQENFNRVHLDIPYLRNPVFLSCYVLTDDFLPFLKRDLKYLEEHSIKDDKTYSTYSDTEVAKFSRILHWMESIPESVHRTNTRRALYHFLKEYEERKNIKFLDYCPEYSSFHAFCKMSFLGR